MVKKNNGDFKKFVIILSEINISNGYLMVTLSMYMIYQQNVEVGEPVW